MYDACPTLKLFRGGPLSSQIDAGRAYLTSLLGTGHAVPRRKLVELELAMADWVEMARKQEDDAPQPLTDDPKPVRAKPWWLRFGGGRV